jgi:hypothetical protein
MSAMMQGMCQRSEPLALGRVIKRFGDHPGRRYFCGLGASLSARGLLHAALESPVQESE